jgi:hypothetical protein
MNLNGVSQRPMGAAMRYVFSLVGCLIFLAGCEAPQQAQNSKPDWIADKGNGCRLWNPSPQPSESVSWSGGCNNGLAEGTGTVLWYSSGRLVGQIDATYRGGHPGGKFVFAKTDGSIFDGTYTDGRYSMVLRKSLAPQAPAVQNTAPITKIANSGCDGIVITGYGSDMYNGAAPYYYIGIRNSSTQRKTVYFDVKWRDISGNMYGAYQNESWQQVGPIIVRPGDDGKLPISTGSSREMRQVNMLSCT